MRHAIRITVAGLIFTACITGQATAKDCFVADPTGTKLNMRLEPNGQIVSTLANGVSVVILAETRVRGKRWAQVRVNGGALGWVFADFLDCPMGGQLKSAPMKPRTAPQ